MSWRFTRATARAPEPPHKVAVIDLGSNSWRLVVFMFSPGVWWKRTDELYETVRIGAGMAATGRLSQEAMSRGLETLDVFQRFCRSSGIPGESVHVVATSAIREATNREEFLSRARERTDLQIEVLSAEEEARLGYVAAINTSTLTDGAVLELGGGSLQLIEVHDRLADQLCSLPLGAVRLTEEFLPRSGKPRRKELERLRAHLEKELADVPWLSEVGGQLVGIGGAVRNLAAAAQHVDEEGFDIGVQGFVLEREVLSDLVDRLAGLTPKERGQVPGIKPGRGDIILTSALTIEAVLRAGRFEGVEATEAGLREGIFFDRELLGRDPDGQPRTGPPLVDDVRRAAVCNLAVQYEADLTHSEHVATLSQQMFDSLVQARLIEPLQDERELLWASAMLHDVGMTISYDDHHKHSQYLIVSAELPGFNPRERALIAQISRYHRKGNPKLGDMAGLAQTGDESLVERCAVILRLAEHLERGRDQSVKRVRLWANGDGVDLHLEADGDELVLPRWSIERYGDSEAFERVFGRRLLIG
ncbi:MAG TPA: Ppx/GppA phosphatase family protein [Solirubrobacteraceae bacterium]|nr:Ppx/GppA phosphatase family protein [Solirubrobacteraceae bacterium]